MGSLFGNLMPWLVGALAALAGVWGYGHRERRRGRQEGAAKRRLEDLQEARNVADKIDDAKRDGNAADRLRAKGRLRD